MALSLAHHFRGAFPQLRYQPGLKRVRIEVAGAAVAETDRPVLVWEPRRIVPSYAVPEADITATLTPATPATPAGQADGGAGTDRPPLLPPSIPFAVHTAEGDPLTVEADGVRRENAAFRLADPDLAGYVVLDFGPFDWWEEDEPIIGHPRDPYHRIDVRRSSRSVRIEHGGHVLAESSHPSLLFEGTFPMARYYLPRADVRVELRPGSIHTTCAYKGHATHHSVMVDGEELPNIAWSYDDPLDDAVSIGGLVSFYQERLDLFVDGEPVERVHTQWSKPSPG